MDVAWTVGVVAAVCLDIGVPGEVSAVLGSAAKPIFTSVSFSAGPFSNRAGGLWGAILIWCARVWEKGKVSLFLFPVPYLSGTGSSQTEAGSGSVARGGSKPFQSYSGLNSSRTGLLRCNPGTLEGFHYNLHQRNLRSRSPVNKYYRFLFIYFA